jgi:hypothetical protein
MRRPSLPLIAALLASAVGLLIGDSHRTLTLAIPAAFVLLALLKKFIDTDDIPLPLKAALLALPLWILAFALFLYLVFPPGSFSCEGCAY